MGAEEITRRDFVKVMAVAGAGVAAAGVTGCGANSGKEAAGVATPSTSYGGDEDMGTRVLVGYATRTGSTVGVAEAIGKALGERGFTVDVKPLREKPSVGGYDAVVLGSAINGAAWLPEAMEYLEANREALASVPTAVFCVHAMNTGEGEKAARKRHAYLDKVRAIVTPVDEGYFAGVGPSPEDTSIIARWAFKAFGGDTEGDSRDWDAIRGWAERVSIQG